MSFINFKATVLALVLSNVSTWAGAATVVVNADEWALSNTGFSSAGSANVNNFVANLVSEFGNTIHAYSTNFAYTQSNLATAMTSAGATYTTGTGITFDLATLNTYNAILLGGNYLNAAQQTVLSQYVSGGGNVYISAGTGVGGSAAEANAWNSFLTPYDIQLTGNYVGPTGNIAMSGDQLFSGVGQLYFNNANGMQLTGNVVCCSNQNLFAVSRDDVNVVPIPASLPLLLAGLGGLGFIARRKMKAA